jgi:hypothetical protein
MMMIYYSSTQSLRGQADNEASGVDGYEFSRCNRKIVDDTVVGAGRCTRIGTKHAQALDKTKIGSLF